jgi:uncharacterized iron-regulated membrane protein
VPLRLLYLIFWHVLGLVLLIGRTSAARTSMTQVPSDRARSQDRAAAIGLICSALLLPLMIFATGWRCPSL